MVWQKGFAFLPYYLLFFYPVGEEKGYSILSIIYKSLIRRKAVQYGEYDIA